MNGKGLVSSGFARAGRQIDAFDGLCLGDERDANGAPALAFTGDDTRFLGDLYQDLSEAVRKRYALLQTPEFVEEFILDQTLEPALADRPLEGFTVIDPTVMRNLDVSRDTRLELAVSFAAG